MLENYIVLYIIPLKPPVGRQIKTVWYRLGHELGDAFTMGRSREDVLREIGEIATLERGKLCELHGKSGSTYHNLQFWSEGRNRCEYVVREQVGAVREAVENYGRYRKLTDEYAGIVERQTRETRKAADGEKKKRLETRLRKQPPGK